MRNRVALFALLALSSCSLFTTDVGPLLRAQESQAAVFDRHSGAFEKMTRGTTMDEAQRGLILGAIEQDRAAFRETAASIVEWADAVGSVDWKAEAKKLLDQLKSRFGGAK